MIQERIIAALFNATWQTIALTLIVALALRFFARTSASARCAVWTGVLVIAVILPVVDFAAMRSVKAPHASADSVPPAVVAKAPARLAAASARALPASFQPLALSPPAGRFEPQAVRLSVASAVQQVARGAFFAWLFGMLFFAARFGLAMTNLCAAKNSIEPLDTAALLNASARRRHVRLGVSDRVAVPCLLGFLAPVIALPRVLAVELSDSDLQRIVLHEAAHLERRDDWFNLLEQIALVVFFFNPALHYIARCIGMEREIACDDRVIAASANRVTYAECLTQLARRCNNRRAFMVPGFFTNRRQILVRIEQLLDRGHNGSPVVGRRVLAAIGALSVSGLLLSQIGIPVVAATISCNSLSGAAPLALRDLLAQHVPARWAQRPMKRAVAKVVAAKIPVAKVTVPTRPVVARARPAAPRPLRIHARIKVHTVQRVETSEVAAPVIPVPSAVVGTRVSEAAPVRSQDGGYSEGMSLAGYRGLSVDQLINLHDHGISPQMIAEFKAAGYTGLSPEQLIELRDHAVSAAFAQAMNAMLHRQLAVDQLVMLRDHGVSISYAADMSAHGLRIMSVEDIVTLRDHGVSASYIAHIRHDLNPTNLSIDELIRLRDAGI